MVQVAEPLIPVRFKAWDDDPILSVLSGRLYDLISSVVHAGDRRELHRAVENAAAEYQPVRSMVLNLLVEKAITEDKTASELLGELNSEAWHILSSANGASFSPSDRRTILDVLKDQMELAAMYQNAEGTNKAALLNAFLDGYWARLKIDLCLTAVVAVTTGEVRAEGTDIRHWLCLELRRHLRQFEGALFANSPVLRERLAKKHGAFVSMEEVERRIGL